jgi:hypothetical protein
MVTPSMCEHDKPAISDDVLRQIAISEAISIRVSTLVELLELANEYESRVSRCSQDFLISQLVGYTSRLRERLSNVVAAINVDVDVLISEIEEGE